MGVEQARIRPIKIKGHYATTCVMGQACFRFVVTTGLLAYGGYLAWENWTKPLHLTATPASTNLAIVAMPIRVVAPLLPGLSCAVIYLSSRRDAPWFHRAGALCLLGLVTAAIEMLVHFIG